MDFDAILGDVYDCAVNPDLWPQTLERIRASLGCAYVMFGYADLTMPSGDGVPFQKLHSSPWDAIWFQCMERHIPTMPGIASFVRAGLDVPWVQMENVTQADLEKTEFYRDWCVRKNLAIA
jgi:hypothetical protein